jgi:putative Mg2+ transporter-C (MgtC) family protein
VGPEEQLRVVLDVVVAMALGGALGLERGLAAKPAGLRTLMLVAGGSAMLMALGLSASRSTGIPDEVALNIDPGRTIQSIILGISFLGAGTISRDRTPGRVVGLTTAACILISAAVGIAVALHQAVLAVGVTFLTVLVLLWLGRLEDMLRGRGEHKPGDPELRGNRAAGR